MFETNKIYNMKLPNYKKEGYHKVIQLVVTTNIYNFLATYFNLTNMT